MIKLDLVEVLEDYANKKGVDIRILMSLDKTIIALFNPDGSLEFESSSLKQLGAHIDIMALTKEK